MSGGEIRRAAISSPAPHAVVQPMMIDPSRQSAQAAIQAVNADGDKANMLNNMQGGWVPNPKTKVIKSKKVKIGGRSGSRKRCSRSRRQRRLNASDARVSRRLRMRMLQRRIKKRKSRRRGSRQMQMRGGSGGGQGGQAPLQPAVQTVPQHGGPSCTAGDTNCAGNISKGILDLNAQAVANSHGDNVSNNTT